MNLEEKVLWLSDIHAPFQDNRTLSAVTSFIHDLNPDRLIIGGDALDFYSISKFDKDPGRKYNFQQELDIGISVVEMLAEAVGDVPIWYLEGNHEFRLETYLKRHPELFGLRVLQVPALLELDRLGIEYFTEAIEYKDMLFKHGDYAQKYSANKELDVEGMSGMSGHVHRNQMMSKTMRHGPETWYSVGHLCDVEQATYMKGLANWQQGIAVVNFYDSGPAEIDLIEIENHSFNYNGITYSG